MARFARSSVLSSHLLHHRSSPPLALAPPFTSTCLSAAKCSTTASLSSTSPSVFLSKSSSTTSSLLLVKSSTTASSSSSVFPSKSSPRANASSAKTSAKSSTTDVRACRGVSRGEKGHLVSFASKGYASETAELGLETFEVATPLCERPATCVASLVDVYRWRNEGQSVASSVGSRFLDLDGGPEVSDLMRELEWLLDDVVEACGFLSDGLNLQAITWKACSWRDVKDSSSAGRFPREEYAAIYGALCKEGHTDSVNEFAEGGFTCDGMRETLEDMGADGGSDDRELGSGMSKVEGESSLQLLLRMSIEEMDKVWKERVQRRRPFQYVVAAAHWRELILIVVEGVLIPRPETEQMVDMVEEAIGEDKSLGQGLWADLGTGSGAIAIGLARLLQPAGSVVAVDASSAAVAVARRNVNRYRLDSIVKVQHGFWLSFLQSNAGELAGVISNPPYIPSKNLATLQAEVGQHEPRIALDGGPDGMNCLREICEGSVTAIRSGGFLALETNGGEQAEVLSHLLSNMRVLGSSGVSHLCFRNVKSVKDFAGIDRFVTATRC